MRTVSFQGVQLTAGQKLRAQQQQHVRAFMSPVLAQQVADTLAVIELRKEQGAKPEKLWFPDRQEHGTPSIAEWMGF
ncbi:hypothetical protein HBO00_24625 [Pseudomonas sp. WS 5407]|uniref:hypothetical protein n=1 Tax=Pseudomonas TaxID=286 RepID=UPI001474C4A9|nr:hypothetical protein [Pseudomonas sp. WS 5407]NMX47364.1 hypothetical protein [Pseudomonas sp. WS 5407]